MRIDKFLKVSRLIKRRSVAKDIIDVNKSEKSIRKIYVNDKLVKASYQVKIGDIILLDFENRSIKVRVLELSNVQTKEKAKEMYEII